MKRKLRFVVASAIAGCALVVGPAASAVQQNGTTYITHPNGCERFLLVLTPFDCEIMAGSSAYIAVHADLMVWDSTGFGNTYDLYWSWTSWCEPSPKNYILHPDITLLAEGRMPTTANGSAYEQRDFQDSTEYGDSLEDYSDGEVDVWANIPRDIPFKGTHDVCFNNSNGLDTTKSSHTTYPQSLTVL